MREGREGRKENRVKSGVFETTLLGVNQIGFTSLSHPAIGSPAKNGTYIIIRSKLDRRWKMIDERGDHYILD